MFHARIIVSTAVILLLTALAWAQASIRPGQYEVTSEVAVPGQATPSKHTSLDCITPAEAENLQDTLVEMLVSEDACTVSNLKSTPGTIMFDSKCDEVTAHSEIKFGPDWITFVLTMTAGGQTTTSTSQAKWIAGTCTVTDD